MSHYYSLRVGQPSKTTPTSAPRVTAASTTSVTSVRKSTAMSDDDEPMPTVEYFMYLMKKNLSKKKENLLTEVEIRALHRVKEKLTAEQWLSFEDAARQKRQESKDLSKKERFELEEKERLLVEQQMSEIYRNYYKNKEEIPPTEEVVVYEATPEQVKTQSRLRKEMEEQMQREEQSQPETRPVKQVPSVQPQRPADDVDYSAIISKMKEQHALEMQQAQQDQDYLQDQLDTLRQNGRKEVAQANLRVKTVNERLSVVEKENADLQLQVNELLAEKASVAVMIKEAETAAGKHAAAEMEHILREYQDSLKKTTELLAQLPEGVTQDDSVVSSLRTHIRAVSEERDMHRMRAEQLERLLEETVSGSTEGASRAIMEASSSDKSMLLSQINSLHRSHAALARIALQCRQETHQVQNDMAELRKFVHSTFSHMDGVFQLFTHRFAGLFAALVESRELVEQAGPPKLSKKNRNLQELPPAGSASSNTSTAAAAASGSSGGNGNGTKNPGFHVQAAVRIRKRPQQTTEREDATAVFHISPTQLEFTKGRESRVYEFDQVLHPAESVESLGEFTRCAEEVVGLGRSWCFIAYGEIGSGKTSTMEEVSSLATDAIFKATKARKGKLLTSFFVSAAEVKGEHMRDLLTTDALAWSKTGSTAASLSRCQISSQKEFQRQMAVLAGKRNSSRKSHFVHTVVLLEVVGEDIVSGTSSHSTIAFVDLGAVENANARSSMSESELFDMGACNKGIAAISDVISSLKSASSFIPYRNSRLSLLLQGVLTPKTNVFIILNVWPLQSHTSEIGSTLTFGCKFKPSAGPIKVSITDNGSSPSKKLGSAANLNLPS
mgnify:CR=1 FL=1